MGAPRKSPERKRDIRTAVMLTAIERAELEERARVCGVTLSEFVRRQALGRAMPASAIEHRARATLATALRTTALRRIFSHARRFLSLATRCRHQKRWRIRSRTLHSCTVSMSRTCKAVTKRPRAS